MGRKQPGNTGNISASSGIFPAEALGKRSGSSKRHPDRPIQQHPNIATWTPT